jgi:D-aminoacyl-tRNA deacylase
MQSTSTKGNYKTAIALGGGHYCPEFTKLLLRTDYALSHICPKYALPNLNAELLKQAISKTSEKVSEIVVDYKGLGEHKENVMQLAEATGLKVQRVRKLL